MTLVVDRGSPPRRLPSDRVVAGKTVESTWDITSVAPHLIGKARIASWN
jgi:hypothetical protein